MSETPYRSIAVAATFSPRFHQVLAEANRVRERFGSELSMIYVGKTRRDDDEEICRGDCDS